MSLSKFFFATSLLGGSNIISKDVKLGIFSYIHLNMNYNPDSSDNYCTYTNKYSFEPNNTIPLSEIKIDQKALLGRLGCDAP